MQDFPGWTTQFELFFRQEQSRQASGRTIVKDFGTPLWRATYQSRPLRPNLLDEWRARLGALGNGLTPFKAWPSSRCWPILHPYGEGAVPGVIATVGLNNKSFTVDWADGETLLSVGDYVEVNARWLFQVTGVAAGVITVAPNLPLGILAGQSVSIAKPGVQMLLVPGTVSTGSGLNGRGTVSFQAIEDRP